MHPLQRYFLYELAYTDTNNSPTNSSKEYWETREEGGARMKGKLDFFLSNNLSYSFFFFNWVLLTKKRRFKFGVSVTKMNVN